MLRPRTLVAACLVGLLPALLGACGGSTGGVEEAEDYLYSCSLEVTNGTANRIVQYDWVLVERRGGEDVVWGRLARQPASFFEPGMEQTVLLGPNYADLPAPSTLEWEVVFTDSTDVQYGPWTIPLSECGGTAFTVTPADAS